MLMWILFVSLKSIFVVWKNARYRKFVQNPKKWSREKGGEKIAVRCSTFSGQNKNIRRKNFTISKTETYWAAWRTYKHHRLTKSKIDKKEGRIYHGKKALWCINTTFLLLVFDLISLCLGTLKNIAGVTCLLSRYGVLHMYKYYFLTNVNAISLIFVAVEINELICWGYRKMGLRRVITAA